MVRMLSVGQLDEDDAHVARHRQQHLAEGLGLRFLARREAQLVELGEAVDEVGGGAPKRSISSGSLAMPQSSIASCISAAMMACVQTPFGAQAGHRDGVGDVGLTAGAELAEVRLVGEAVAGPRARA